MFKLVLEEPEIKFSTSVGSSEKQESSRKKSTSALLTMPKPLCGSPQTEKILKEMGILDHLTCLLKSRQGKKQHLEPDIEQWPGSKLGKEYNKVV